MKRKIKRFFLILSYIACVGLIAVIGIDTYVRMSVQDRILTEAKAVELDVDCILVLGAGVAQNKPSAILEDRLLQGIALYEMGVSDRLLMSGDHGQPEYDEVNVMKKFAMEKGVPADHIFMDHAGFSTYESLYRARDVFAVKRAVIVTQEYHMYRALYIGKQLGLEVYGVTSDPREYTKKLWRETREILARCKDFFYVLFDVPPTYLGETIPVSASGSLTDDGGSDS